MVELQGKNNYKGIIPRIKILGSRNNFWKVQTLDSINKIL